MALGVSGSKASAPPGHGHVPMSGETRSDCPAQQQWRGVSCSARHGCGQSLWLGRRLFCVGAMLMRAHDSGINHGVFIVSISRQRLESTLPDAALAPARVQGMDHSKFTEALR